jgi:hypothetical protein
VSLDEIGLLVGLSLLLGLAKLLDETHGAALQATVDPAEKNTSAWACSLGLLPRSLIFLSSRARSSCGSNILVKVDSSVGELSERSLSLELGSLLGVLSKHTRQSSSSFIVIPLIDP